MITRLLLLSCFALIAASVPGLAQAAPRKTPVPLPDHPGNVFLEGEEVVVAAPADAARWTATDYDGKERKGTAPECRLGKLDTGWYRVEFLDAAGKTVGHTTAGVLARLAAPTPHDSPVCVDSAAAWFARRHKPREAHAHDVFASLAELAGVNWVRDRMSWGEAQPKPDRFAEDTRYDSSATLHAKHGLSLLQVHHSSPAWVIDRRLDGKLAYKRFPRDLRMQYRFCRAMAERNRGRVQAWEPWNEANIEPFGGHSIDEMCSLQKAAYFGLKAGNAGITACWNVYAGPGSRLHTEGVLRNEAWPYFDTYNIHTYSKPHQYLDQFATARDGACGKPIWMTECGIRLRTADPKPWGDLPPDVAVRQAEFVAKSYASSLFAGVDRHFFFILGNYIERGTQFGLLRHDFTPRPGYLALAAVGRLLAGATCLGRVTPTIYVFRARPDGRERDVIVAWADKPCDWVEAADVAVDAGYDHLGRRLAGAVTDRLGPAPRFVVTPKGQAEALVKERPPSKSSLREGKPCPIVLQLSLPHDTTRLGNQAHEVEPGTTTDLPVYAYNFGDAPASGTVSIEDAPAGWRVDVAREPLRLAAMERKRLPVSVALPASGRELLTGQWIRLRGEFGDAGRPVLAFRLAADLAKVTPVATRAIASGDAAANWQDNIVRDGKMSHGPADGGGVLFDMTFGETDPWAYPRLRLKPGEAPSRDFDGLALTIQVLEGLGTVRVQFVEKGGSCYVTEAGVNAEVRTPQRARVQFEHCKWGSYSKPDPNGRLDPEDVLMLLVGINARRHARVRMAVQGLEWVKF